MLAWKIVSLYRYWLCEHSHKKENLLGE
jgi:hypothetical protein